MISRRQRPADRRGFPRRSAHGPGLPLAGEAVEIRMQGNTDGSHVWFDPVGLRIEPGQTIRWINLDPGNSHTATAYHPNELRASAAHP